MMVIPTGTPGGRKIAPACAAHAMHEEEILLGVLHEMQIFCMKGYKIIFLSDEFHTFIS